MLKKVPQGKMRLHQQTQKKDDKGREEAGKDQEYGEEKIEEGRTQLCKKQEDPKMAHGQKRILHHTLATSFIPYRGQIFHS